jgi:hypothetical protein
VSENGKVILSRGAILGIKQLRQEPLLVPEWGGTVYVRELTAAERDEVETWSVAAKREDNPDADAVLNLRARVAVKSVVDDKGLRLFSDKDADELGQKSASALDAIFSMTLGLSGMSKAERERLEKNLKAQAEALANAASTSD